VAAHAFAAWSRGTEQEAVEAAIKQMAIEQAQQFKIEATKISEKRAGLHR
jgi:hypothetical protein